MKRSFFAVLTCGCVACSSLACSSNGGSPDAADAATPTDASPSTLDGGAEGGDAGSLIPDTPAGARLAWVLSALDGAPITDADVTAQFTADFLKSVPATAIEQAIAQLAQKKPWTLLGLEGASTPSSLVAILTRGDGQRWRLTLATSSAEHDAIAGLAFTPAGDLDPALASYDAIDAALRPLAARVSMMAADVTAGAGGCTPLHVLGGDASLGIASAFKLWVLAALAQSVQAGQHAWTDPVAIQDKYKSLPSGELQSQPNGTLLPLRTYAEKMISISDNTAADHLLFTLGRDAVEAMLTATKHHDPASDQPFPGTREMFTLKLLLSPADQQAYVAAPTAQKRTLLAQYDATLDPRTWSGAWTTPKQIDTLEWFATPMDLCNVMATLKGYGDQAATAPVYDVLSINPGIPDVPRAFSYVGFKGGSEPGVVVFAWLVRRASDGRWRFVTVGLNDPTKALDEDAAGYVAGAARALLAK